jgi:Tfp pilus assembly protein PilN
MPNIIENGMPWRPREREQRSRNSWQSANGSLMIAVAAVAMFVTMWIG